MPLLSESPTVLPIHRKILAFSFIGWIFDFYDLLLLSFLISPSVTSIVKDLALTPSQIAILLGTPLAFTAVGGFIGGDVASTWPVMITSAICRVKGIRSQKPRPQASTVSRSVAGVAASAAAITSTVAINAKMKASGTQRSVQSVNARAARATGPGCSVILSGGYLNIGATWPC